MTQSAIEYTINCIFNILGLKEKFDFKVADNRKKVIIRLNNKEIHFNLLTEDKILKLLNREIVLNKIFSADKAVEIPIILDEDAEFVTIEEEVLCVNADILSISFIVLSRYEEFHIDRRNALGNFEYKDSLAFFYDFIDYPIVDEYAILLRPYLRNFLPELEFTTNKYQIIPSHDIDEILRYEKDLIGFRRIVTDLLQPTKHSIKFSRINDYIKIILNKNKDPFYESIYTLLHDAQRLNLDSEFYFMTAKKSMRNRGYNILDFDMDKFVSLSKKGNHKIGLHGGFGTRNNLELLRLEKIKLESATKFDISICRQHYLNFEIKETPYLMEENGILVDSSLGYNEKEGFRCGTCHEYSLWDFRNDCEFKLIERPLIVMDITLFKYKAYSKKEAIDSIFKLNSRCIAVGGKFTILWHNTYVKNFKEWYDDVFIHSLESICKLNCCTGPDFNIN
jgi:hypothetical protein